MITKKLFIFLFIFTIIPITLHATEENKGNLSNLVVFILFSDESDTIFEKPLSYYETLFNDSTTGTCSVYNYFKTASYNQLFWTSGFYPSADTEAKNI